MKYGLNTVLWVYPFSRVRSPGKQLAWSPAPHHMNYVPWWSVPCCGAKHRDGMKFTNCCDNMAGRNWPSQVRLNKLSANDTAITTWINWRDWGWA